MLPWMKSQQNFPPDLILRTCEQHTRLARAGANRRCGVVHHGIQRRGHEGGHGADGLRGMSGRSDRRRRARFVPDDPAQPVRRIKRRRRVTIASYLRVADLQQEIAHQLIEDRGVLEIDRMAAAGHRAQPRIGQRGGERLDDPGRDQRVLLADHAQYRHRQALLHRREIVAQAEQPDAGVGGRARAVNPDLFVQKSHLGTPREIVGRIRRQRSDRRRRING